MVITLDGVHFCQDVVVKDLLRTSKLMSAIIDTTLHNSREQTLSEE